jgi:2-(1,2-epoxy-1,2-dihydrophenyl)acetyl-CoA isomerase
MSTERRLYGYTYLVDADTGIATITFDSPQTMNAHDTKLRRQLMETLQEAEWDDAVRVIVFRGTGRAFSAGDNIAGTPLDDPALYPEDILPHPEGARGSMRTFAVLRGASQLLTQTVRRLSKVTIASVNGFAIQSGLTFALACDFRIAAESAKLGSGTLRFAMQADEGGLWMLVQHMGVGRTMDFVLRKRIVTAHEALDLGLLHEVVPDADLDRVTMALAAELAAGPQMAMRLAKRGIYTAAEASLEQALEDIALRTALSDHHPDMAEGARAFRAKEKPNFA